jgi:predicted alpha/beta superfamily hydrolase
MKWISNGVMAIMAMVLCLTAIPLANANAQLEGDKIYLGEFRTLQSEVLGEERIILVYTPAGYDRGQTKYPVLFLLDGPAHFHHVTGIIEFMSRNRLIPQMIVVAIANTDRSRDLTPTQDKTRIGNTPTAGGADNFLAFLKDELIPFVDQNYRTQPYRILIGHSFGGLFAMYCLIAAPETFNSYIAISPTFWWDDHFLARKAKLEFKDRLEMNNLLYITLGNEGQQMIDGAQRFATFLEDNAPAGLEWEYHFMENEDHSSIPHRSIYDGLEFLYRPWKMDNILLNGELADVQAHYDELSRRYGYKIVIEEVILNAMGYQALARAEYEKAIEIFKLAARLYPESANVYDSLGEGYEASNQLELAKENYEIAIQKGEAVNDPNLPIYKLHLANIQALRGG